MKKGHKYGTHRVISPKGVLPQPADKLDNNMDEIYDNEILIDVQTLNIDSASFTQISNQAGGDKAKIAEIMLDIVEKQGKHRNPVTGSGGMLLGTVEKIGDALVGKTDLKVGDIYAKIPSDLPEKLVMSALDVAGAPAQVAKLVRPGNTVLIIGAAGKSGMLCCYEARKRVGVTGKVIGLCYSPEEKERLDKLGFCHEVVCMDARQPIPVLEKITELTNGEMCDITINNVNVPDTEMTSILCTKNTGIVYFFSMATSFTKAALGAEGVGSDVTMIIGNGYTKGHAEITLQEFRECEALRKIFTELYA